ncbi:hypothetical protein L3Y34_000456 [Caenorhabditis briggsae]|uniref:Uncharacterized protein n=1 Tax=Caenorhabditis briggsae TaxID=6238 RepID=A0AAE9IMS1_CAEBR|nr:hypothetical protein L3Y34_000456 [Caenorhabditis briggsae]
MEPSKWSGVILALIVLFHAGYTAKQAVVSRKSKLCGNTECEEILFKARVKRVMGVNNDPNFLNLAENAIISVVAVKFSDRPDIMEGKLNGEGPSGFFYVGAIDILPFAEFLRSAIDEKKEMLMISQNPSDTGDKRIVGFVHSETDLVRDYNAKNAQAAAENGLPAPEPLPIPEPAHSGGHGHSHGGHGHSHGGHGHSHGAPKAQEVPETRKIPSENAPEVVKMPDLAPEVAEKAAPEAALHLQNVLGNAQNAQNAPKIALPDMEQEIDRMIREEEERMAKALEKSEKSPEEPLILSSQPIAQPNEASTVTQKVEEQATVTQEPIAQDNAVTQKIEEPAVQPTEPIAQPAEAPEPIAQHATVTPAPEISPEAVPPPPIAQYIPPTTTVPPPIAQEPEATVPPVVEQPATTTVSPIAEHPTTVPPTVAQQPEEPTTVVPPPATIPEAQSLPVGQDELTGTCYKENCDGLQTPTPPEAVTTPPEAAPESHHAHAHDVHGHSHSEDVAPEVPEATTVPPASPEEEEFLKWEEERRKKREAAPAEPYEDAQGHQFLPPTPPPTSSGILEVIRSSLGVGNVTDGTILMYINLTFVLASLVFYIIVRSLSSGGDSTDIMERQAYFELMTKHKQLLLQLQAKEAEIRNLQQNGVQQQQQQQMPNHEPELLALREQVQHLQNELQTSLNQRRDFEIHYNQLRDAAEQKESTIAQLNETANDYKERLQKASDEIQDWARQLDTTRAELNELQQTAYGRQQEAIERRQQEGDEYEQKIQELTSEKKALAGRIQNLEEDFERVQRQLEEERELNSGLQGSVQRLETELEASKNANDAAESGGSGWSDCGDIEDVEKEKDLQKVLEDDENLQKAQKETQEELSRLKLKLEQSEKEATRYRNLYERQNETESRGAIEIELKLKNAENEIQEARRKIEELSGEKKELGDRLNEMLKNLNSTMSKAADNDKMFTTLRDEAFAKDKQLLETDAVIRKKDEKIRELDASVKRIEREYLKLEAKSFHDVMSLKKQLDDYKSAQILSGGGPPSRDVFSGNISSNSQNRPISRTDRLAPSPLDEPIWDEPEPYVPNQQLGGNAPHESDYYSSGSMSMGRRRSTRRSHLVQAESPSDQEKSTSSKSAATKKEGVVHRRRSRSTGGRQYPQYVDQYSLTNQYMPGSSDSSFLSMGGATVGGAPGFQPLSNRHSRSGHLSGGGGGGHYSSGGSNGGRSPPPEMPLLGAIPPIGARKPLIKRPDSSHHHGK